MYKTLSSVMLLGGFCLCSTASAAILYSADDRYIYHSYVGTATPTPAYSDFNEDYWSYEAGAYQNSSVSSAGMSGTGSTYAGYDAYYHYGAYGQSDFDVTFTVDQLTDYVLDVTLDAYYWDSAVSYTLFENGAVLYTSMFGDTGAYNHSGQFDPANTYRLLLTSYAYFSDYYNETWSFTLTTSTVPVPAAAWLFGSGLLMLLGVNRSARR